MTDEKKPDDKKLKSLAEMAKRGYGNERENAERLLRKLCEKHNLEYDSVLNDLLLEEFTYYYAEAGISKKLTVQTLARYAMPEGANGYWENRYYKSVTVKTTKEKWNEFLSAILEVKRKYEKQRAELNEKHRVEKKNFFEAFIHRHGLFYPYKIDRKPGSAIKKNTLTDKDLAALRRMMGEMDEDLQVHKQIGSGK